MNSRKSFQDGGKRQLISLGVIIVLILLTFYTLYSKTDDLHFKTLAETWDHLNKAYLALAFVSMLCFVVIEGLCLGIIAKPLGYHFSLKAATVYAAADLYFSAITPSATGGQPASAYYMAKDGVKVSDATTILILNILQYTVSLILMSAVALIAKLDFFIKAGGVFRSLFMIGFVLQILLLAICLLCMFSRETIRSIGTFLVKSLYKLKFIKYKEEKLEKINNYIDSYQAGVDYVKRKPGLMGVVLGSNILQRLAFFSVGYFVYRSFGLHELGYWDLIMVQTLLAMAVNSLPIPGAIGVSEGSFLLLFKSIYLGGTLMPALIFTRGINYYICFVLCGIITIAYHISIMKREKNKRRNQ